jgi:tetrahydromethanopterin S-methyltransferase subunit G
MNTIMEGHKRLDEWFNKVERVLNENFEVIGKLLVPKIEKTDDASSNGAN